MGRAVEQTPERAGRSLRRRYYRQDPTPGRHPRVETRLGYPSVTTVLRENPGPSPYVECRRRHDPYVAAVWPRVLVALTLPPRLVSVISLTAPGSLERSFVPALHRVGHPPVSSKPLEEGGKEGKGPVCPSYHGLLFRRVKEAT